MEAVSVARKSDGGAKSLTIAIWSKSWAAFHE